MSLALAPADLPLVEDADGVMRVGMTRVTLDTVISAFVDGASAEEIVQRYPTVHLADAYSVIGYYLRHDAEIDAYLLRRRTAASAVRSRNESCFDPVGVRARLLARRAGTGP